MALGARTLGRRSGPDDIIVGKRKAKIRVRRTKFLYINLYDSLKPEGFRRLIVCTLRLIFGGILGNYSRGARVPGPYLAPINQSTIHARRR